VRRNTQDLNYGQGHQSSSFAADPKSFSMKDEFYLRWEYPMSPAHLRRPINILALGGSVTWGETLRDRYKEGYPWLIGSPYVDHVDNYAMPPETMGVYYSYICLQSIIPEEKRYDVILLDFIASEREGFLPFLLRLRERFPDAIIIYIHIWPLKALIRHADNGLQPDILGLDPTLDWSWIPPEFVLRDFHPDMCRDTKSALEAVSGYFWNLGFPRNPMQTLSLYSDDWWHLSAEGHKVIANGILQLLSKKKDDVFKAKRLGRFKKGDQCFNWLLGGNTAISYSNIAMARVVDSETTNHTELWLLMVDNVDGGTIEFKSKFKSPVPIVAAFLTNDANIYSSSNFFNISNTERIRLSSSASFSTQNQPPVSINPNVCFRPKHFPKISYEAIGIAAPGNNIFQVKTTDQQKIPFQLAGLYLNEDLNIPNAPEVKLGPIRTSRHAVFCFMQTKTIEYRVNYSLVEKIIEETKERLDGWTIHVLTSGDEFVQRMSAHSDLNVVDIRDAAFSNIISFFDRNYVHQSSNDVEFEKFCMYRWTLIAEYFSCLQMRGISIEHLVVLDTDTLILDNPLSIDKEVDWSMIETYRFINGAATVWSLKGLYKFVDFVIDTYKDHEKAAQVAVMAGTKTSCVEQQSLLVPCFKDDKSGNVVMYQISDMHLYNSWVLEDPVKRVQQAHEKMECRIVRLFPDTTYQFFLDGTDVKLLENREKVCVIHFLGVARQWIHSFGKFIHEETSSELTLSKMV
jgi:hypothetical protein